MKKTVLSIVTVLLIAVFVLSACTPGQLSRC